MKITRILALAAAAFLLLAPAAHAQQSYVSFSGGAYVPEGQELDDNNADTGMAFFLNSGYMMTPFYGAQCDIGYFETSGDNNLQVSAIPLAISLKLAVPLSFFEPYVLGGAGVYFAQTEFAGINDNSTEFAPHAAAGFNLNFGRVQLGLEARYIWLEANDLDVDGMLVLGKFGTRF